MTDETQEFFSKSLFSGSCRDKAFQSPSLVVVENRALIGECLALCLQNKLRLPVLTYPDVKSWAEDPLGSSACAIILSGLERQISEQFEIIRELCRRQTGVPVVIFSDTEKKDQIAKSLRCGVRGYISSDTPLEIAARAIKLVIVGGVFIPAALVMEEDDDVEPEALGSAKFEFTPREYDVVRRLLKGESNKLIAHELNLSESSVKVHIRNIMRRLGVHNRTEAVIALGSIVQSKTGHMENPPGFFALGPAR
ncbi:response regulator transcription factor [Methylocystis echinoides]|jgi:DNA-binding NarL/FixJ family response regulator|uniref:response regulator transcription factor n=1 Tax=Methylocystis echinoides TaxID=29468 RepID=UPI0034404544